MTSASNSGSADGTMAHLSPSASTTQVEIPTQSDGRTNVISTSSEDVVSTQAQFDELQLTTKPQLPFSIGEPSSSLEDETSDISQTIDRIPSSTDLNTLAVAEVNPTVQTMPPSWISASTQNPSTEYSPGSSSLLSSTPTLPQSILASQTNIKTLESNPVSSSVLTSATSVTRLNPSSSQIVITKDSGSTYVPTVSKTVDKFQPKTKVISTFPTKAYKTTSSTLSQEVPTQSIVPTSSIVPGILPAETTPFSGDAKEPHSGYPNATILFIIVPVCVVVVLVLSAILVACVRRRKYMKKPTSGQNPDLWVNTRTELALAPAPATGIDTPSETVPGFKPGDIVCQVVYPFQAQLEGQMTLKEKELVKVLEKADNGWWRGATENEEHSGWFPGCYVEEVKPGDFEDGTQSQSKGKSRVSSFLLKKRERIRRRSATAVSPLEMNSGSNIPTISTSRTLPVLNSAEINKFNDGRIYKALFSYQGSSKGELSIEEGDIVRGWEKDRNGWMHGRKVVNGEEGWFPAVYVDEIPSDTSSVSGESTLSGPIMYDQLAPNKTRKSDQEWLGIEHRAVHPYLGQSETDLTFEAGDTIIIFETLDNGWWLGSRGEEVGWLPGSYLEILDSSRDDESSRSDVSSLLSSNDDRNRATEDELSHLTSNQSLNSTLSDSKPKPKPARKAPPPPKLKPLKVPVREFGQQSTPSVTSELHNVVLKIQSPTADSEVTVHTNQGLKPTSSLAKSPSGSKPKRPAPPPPPHRAASQQSQLQSQPVSPELVSVSPVVASSSLSSVTDSKLKPGEKPVLPKRFAKPRIIKLPRQSSKLQNLAVNSRPSSRPAPPRPPPPKLNKNMQGNIAGKVQYSNNVSGKYIKKTDSNLENSHINSMCAEQENNNLQPVSATSHSGAPPVTRQKVTPVCVPPITVPSSIITPESRPESNIYEEPDIVRSVSKPDKEDAPDSATVEDSPTIYAKIKPKPQRNESETEHVSLPPLEQSQTNQNENEIANIPPPGTLLYPLETGPSMSPPVVPPIVPLVVPPQPAPEVPPILPPKVPRMSQERAISPVYSTIFPVSSTASPEVPQVSSGVDTTPVNTPVNAKLSEVIQVSSPEDTTVVNIPDASCEASQKVPHVSSPVDSSPATSPVISSPEPPEDTQMSPSADISPVHSSSVSENSDRSGLSPTEDISYQSANSKSSEASNIDHVSPSSAIIPTLQMDSNGHKKPPPPPKPSRMPPPVLPKPKIKPKPVSTLVAVDMPTEGLKECVSNSEKETDRFSSNTDSPPPPPPSDSITVGNPGVEEDIHISKGSEGGIVSVNTKNNVNDVSDDTKPPLKEESTDNEGLHVVPDGHSEGDGSDSDDDFLRNGDITSNSSATYSSSSSEKSDTIQLGADIGESDDHHFNSAENLGSPGKLEDSPNSLPTEDYTRGEFKPENDANENVGSNEQTDDTVNNTESFNGIASQIDKETDTETVQDQEHINDESPPELSSNQPEPINGQLELSNGHSDESPDHSERSSSPSMTNNTENKPVPLPRTAVSPKQERSVDPPARPPPPKSPRPSAHRLVSQVDVPNKPKKKTLRRAVKTHVPQGKGELAFEEGSFIKEMSKAIGRPGWCIGMLADGTTGLYPQSHVEDAVSTRQSLA